MINAIGCTNESTYRCLKGLKTPTVYGVLAAISSSSFSALIPGTRGTILH